MRYYAGCGSQETPEKVLQLIRLVAATLSKRGITLRTTEQTSADLAFRQGSNGKFFTYLTAQDFEGSSVWGIPPISSPSDVRSALARKLDPRFLMKTELEKGQELAAIQVMLGCSTKDPAKMLIVYGADSFSKRCVELASQYQIPVFDLALKADRAKVMSWLNK